MSGKVSGHRSYFISERGEDKLSNWYNKTNDEVLGDLGTSLESGISSNEANSRIQKYGKNELQEGKRKSFFARLVDQFKDPMIIILLAASVVSIVAKEVTDALIIIAIVVVNAVLSLSQEGKAEEAIASLKKMSSPNARVIRNGKTIELPSPELVPGDIVLLETGSIIPADMRLLETTNLKVDEASLTGESVPVEKHAELVYDGKMEIGDRKNMCYSSTIVAYGRGVGVVVDTGHETEIGKIATSLQTLEDEETPLQKKLAGLSKTLGIIVLVVCGIVFAVGAMHDLPIKDMFMTAISLAVAAIPEGLPAIVTIVLSLGMGRMAEKHAIVKKLLAVETLGTTTVICSDKTGTLTQNEMTVVKAYVNGQDVDVTGTGYEPVGEFKVDGNTVSASEVNGLELLMDIATLTNDAKLETSDGGYKMFGDPTEGALLTFSGKHGIVKSELEAKYERAEEIPFDSARKMMTTFHMNYGGQDAVSFTKGAPDIIIDRCNYIILDGEVKAFTPELKATVLSENSKLARGALRVLAYAMRAYNAIPDNLEFENIENDMIFVGLTGMIDPPRTEVKQAIKECKDAGIIPIMITGDYLDTAFAIGKDLGMAEDESQAIMGRELNDMSEEEIREVVKTKRIFARVSPENKMQIVTALKQNGHITAMTGDGVNDAPAIKKADIGIAMGITGTDVAKDTAEVILTDDNFATIVHAVEEGRIIYANIKKFVSFLLSCNIGEVLIVLFAILANIPVPFTPIQLLWLNLVTDSFPALALGMEKGEDDIMDQPPRDVDEKILDKRMITTIAVQSVAITIATLVAYVFGLNYFGDNINGARTMAFATLILSELLRSYSVRSDKYTLMHIGPFSNKRLVQATFLSFLLMIVVMVVPFLEEVFDLVDLGLIHWAVIIPCSFAPLIIGEISKVLRRDK